MKRFVATLCCLFFSLQFSNAQTTKTILDNQQHNSSGVKIVAGGWTAADAQGNPVDADATYNAFNKVRNGSLGQYDFYYSLEIVPQFKSDYSDCSTVANLGDFLQALFGVQQGAIIVVKADVQYRWTTGTTINFLSNDAGLLAAGLGSMAPPATAGFGCYFDTTLRPTFPLLQYGGAGPNDSYDDFVIKFIVIGGSATELKAIQTVLSLFSDISAAARWATVINGLATPVSQAGQAAAGAFQTALQNASTIQNQVSVDYTLRANGGPTDGRLAISIPNLFSKDPDSGNLALYVRRTGSIILSNLGSTISLSTVFDNPEVANRQCNAAAIASGNCNVGGSNGASTANADPLRIALAKLLKPLDSGLGDGTGMLTKIMDVKDQKREANVFALCKGLRTVSREYLHLSTLDETMIRRAVTREGGLQDALKSAGALPKTMPLPAGTAPTDGAALAKATGADSLAELADMCWNDGDEQTLEGVAANLKKKISSN